MDFREKAALILLAVILYETACSKCMPQCLRDSPFARYINKQRYSPNIPTNHENGRKTHRFEDDLTKQSKLYGKISPIDVSDSLINNLKREKRMKRKLQIAQKIYTRDNDDKFTIPASFHDQGTSFYLSEVGLFPEVQYPLTASDTWTQNYWNSLPSNNHDRFFKKDAYVTGLEKRNTYSDVFNKTPSAKKNKSSAIIKKSEEVVKRENIKKSTGTKSNKIVRQTTASQGQNHDVDSFGKKEENDIERYLMETPKLPEKKNVSTGTNNEIGKSKNKQVSAKKKINQNISNDKGNETQTKENNRNTKQNIMTKKKKTNDSIEKINKAVSQEKMSKVTEQKNTSKEENPQNFTKTQKTFSPKTKARAHMKSVTKKSMSSTKDVTSHFSKLITKLEEISNKHKINSTASTNQIIGFSSTNETSNSTIQEEESKTKVPAQNILTNILQVETKMSKENMEAPEVELLNLVRTISDKTNTSNEGAQTSFKTNAEDSVLPFSFTDYVVRNQLLEILSDSKLSISSMRNGIFNILEEIDFKSVEESDETPLTGINESTHMLPLMEKYLKEDNLKSLLSDHGISCLDKQDLLSSLENFNEAILPCTNASNSSSEIIFKNNILDDIPVDTQHSDNLCDDVPQISDDFITESQAENLRNVISEPSNSNSLIEDLSEIIRLLTVWNSHTDDSCENVHQTSEIDTIDGYVPITTELSLLTKTAVTDHSYEVISDSDVMDLSIKDKAEYSCDIHKFNNPDLLGKGENDCSTEEIFKSNENYRSKYEDLTNSSCENNHELNAVEYSSDDSANYSYNNKYNETDYPTLIQNISSSTCDDIHKSNATKHLNEDVANSCEYIYKYNETEPSYENVVDIRVNILKQNVSEGVIYYSIDDIHSCNLTNHSNEDQTEKLCEDVHKPNVYSYEGVIYDSYEDGAELNVTDYSNEDINKPITMIYSCEDAANCLYEDKSESNVTNISCERIQELYAMCYSSEIGPNYSCEDTYKSSDENVADIICNYIYNPDITELSNEDTNSLKVTVIPNEGINDNSFEEICKLNVTDQSNEDKTESLCDNIHKHNATVHSSEDTNDAWSEHSLKFIETKYTNIADTREDITNPNVNDYLNESVVDNSHEYISTPNVTDYYSNEDVTNSSWECIHQSNATVCSCEDVADCSNEDISYNNTYFSNEEVTNFSCEHIHKSNVTEYSYVDETEYSSKDTYKPKTMFNLNEGVINYTDEQNLNTTLADYSCEVHRSFAIENLSEINNRPYSYDSKLKSNVTDQSNEILNNFPSEDIALSNVIKRKVKNMAKLNMLEHDTKGTEKHDTTHYFNETIADSASNDLFKPNTTNYLSEILPNAEENISKANVDDSKEWIPESSGANYLNEDIELVSDSPTIYHIPFEKLTYATNDNFSNIPIDFDDKTVSYKVTEDSMRTSHRDLSGTTPLSVSPSFTYEVNEEIPYTELVTFEKFDNITSSETITDNAMISNNNSTTDFLAVFTFDDVFNSLSGDSESPIAFVSTYLPSFDENILKLHNETETEMFENYLPTIPNRDKKTYDEVCPITKNESSENQRFMIDDLAHLNNSRCFTNHKDDLLNPFTNNITELFGDEENPDFYDFILYPEEDIYTEASANNDTRGFNNDTTVDFTDYTVLPEDTTFTGNSEENYIETTVNPFDQYDDVPEQNAETNVSEGTSRSNEIIHNVGNTYLTRGTFKRDREVKSSTDYASLSEDPKLTKYFHDDFEQEHEIRPLYERNGKPLLHREFV